MVILPGMNSENDFRVFFPGDITFRPVGASAGDGVLFYNTIWINYPEADPGGRGRPHPVKTSQKKMAATPQMSRVIGHPSDKFLDPLLLLQLTGVYKYNIS